MRRWKVGTLRVRSTLASSETRVVHWSHTPDAEDLDEGRYVRYMEEEGITALHQDRDGNLWIGTGGNGLYLLVWGKGRCGGNAYINDNKAGRVDWEVPRQVNACYQDGKPERLAARSYSCSVRGSSMNCRETIYLDDGKIWRENEGVVFTAQ